MQAVMHIKPLYFYTKKMVTGQGGSNKVLIYITAHQKFHNFLVPEETDYSSLMKGYGFNTQEKFIYLNPLGGQSNLPTLIPPLQSKAKVGRVSNQRGTSSKYELLSI